MDYKAEAGKWGRYAAELKQELEAMTKARDHCKRQLDDQFERHQSEMAWLRDNHPDVYEEAISAHAWG